MSDYKSDTTETNEIENIEPKPHKEHMKEHKQQGDFKRWGQRSKKQDGND